MTDDTLQTLDFERIRRALAERVSTRLGEDRVRAWGPLPTPEEAARFRRATQEAAALGYRLGGVFDPRPLLARIRRGERPEGAELVEAAATLERAAELKREILAAGEGELARVAARIGEHALFRRRVAESLDEAGEVKDDATPKLKRIRRSLNPLRERIIRRLEAVMDAHPEAVQERYVTLRRDRYVIPVRAQQQRQIGGIVLAQSDTGATVFMEPASVVPLNNELAQLRLEEEAEVLKVLAELAGLLAGDAELEATLDALAWLDAVRAAALLAEDWELTPAQDGPVGRYHLVGARHPLLDDPVPNDLHLSERTRILLVTGPNMGGKTVLLKTLGLAVLMHQAGLFVAAEAAELGWVRRLEVDIGDEQSLEGGLSTFAAHLKKLDRILDSAAPDALVLVDELGSGTDPEEGAALAQAVILRLLDKGARGIVTTHLTPLKALAGRAAGLENASMGFVLEEFRPTYRLQVGLPGRSYALAVARRLGLDEEVLRAAERFLGEGGARVEELLERLERQQAELETRLAAAERARREAEAVRGELQARLERIDREREALLEAARAEVDRMLEEAHRQIRELRAKARKGGSGKRDALREVMAIRERTKPRTAAGANPLPGLEPGMLVEVPSYRQKGRVVRVEGEETLVQIGQVKIRVPTAELRPRGEGAPRPKQAVVVESGFETELNVRGLTAAEALEAVHDFLAEAVATGNSPVRILHGKGTGVLRREIQNFLRHDRRVERFHDAMPNEGGHGVTVVHLRV
ncbi:DNA mismatch repair protein, MutS family [Oceanithermus profundus DSM 14977]|uniref:Endonuclease MutS2 n=1 Tax=Oceanithermus profundus (strain DSM 14977 / NBRC 100410 / VKM B-2274 / 506) TaxID=670487 RepID=E4UA59_OCEP5|nr:Smr/MutS family protein [Oceanithermus profundus]ADR37436.1 DNA mismatch repair protein, MutS family [Oceanithermus profundus DSM 14977]